MMIVDISINHILNSEEKRKEVLKISLALKQLQRTPGGGATADAKVTHMVCAGI